MVYRELNAIAKWQGHNYHEAWIPSDSNTNWYINIQEENVAQLKPKTIQAVQKLKTPINNIQSYQILKFMFVYSTIPLFHKVRQKHQEANYTSNIHAFKYKYCTFSLSTKIH